jgi:hypothetical protein
MVGDGYTYMYYALIDHISAAMHGSLKAKQPFDWSPSPPAAYAPLNYTEHDRYVMCKSWLPGLAENAKENAKNPRIATWAVVNKEAVDEIKKEKLSGEKSCSFLSTNDIIVAGISEVATASITCVMMSMRGRVENLGPERPSVHAMESESACCHGRRSSTTRCTSEARSSILGNSQRLTQARCTRTRFTRAR